MGLVKQTRKAELLRPHSEVGFARRKGAIAHSAPQSMLGCGSAALGHPILILSASPRLGGEGKRLIRGFLVMGVRHRS